MRCLLVLALGALQDPVRTRTPVEPREAPAHAITGIILEPGGKPPLRSEVIFAWDDRGRLREAREDVGADGRFALEVDDWNATGDLLAYIPGRSLAPRVLTGVHVWARDLELRLGDSALFTL